MIKCPYCHYEDDECNFPDYFDDCEAIKQYFIDYAVNIVTCGMCGKAIVIEDWENKNER